ncbi:MAG: hypothetical protein ACP5OA_07690 [Candidatus Woesearchaeota archaeon]
MDFDKWSFEKRKEFLKSLKYKDNDQIYAAFKKEGLELHKSPEGTDFIMMTPNGYQYYFAVKPLTAKLTPTQKKMKEKYKQRYFLIVRESSE